MIKAVKILLLALIIFMLSFLTFSQLNPTKKIIELPTLPDTIIKPIKTIKIADTIKKRETLSTILTRNGVSQNLVHPVIASFKKCYSVKRLMPGDRYTIETDSSGSLLSFTYLPTDEKKYVIYSDKNGSYSYHEVTVELVKKIKYLRGTIQSTLYEAILEAGETPELLFLFTDIFQWDIDFFIDPRFGDRFKIVYEKLYTPDVDKFVRYGKILAAQYTLNYDTLTAIYFDNTPADDGYYDLNGKSFQKTFLKSPLNFRRISSYFSYSRRHPILKKYRPHYGIDYAARKGTPVSAAADGIVIDKGYDRGIGNFVKLRHKNARFVTLYGHLSRFGKGIVKGERVKQKQIIGYVGRTGLATGPHLHYAFYNNGRPVDPLKIENTSGDPVLAENNQRFCSVRDLMLDKLAYIDYLNIPLIFTTASQVHYNRYTIPER